MRNKRITLLACALLLGLSLPGKALESRGKTDFTGMLNGFLKSVEAGAGGGCPVTVKCPSGGVTLSCTGTTCVKEEGRCVKCDKSAQFCPGTTGTTCGTSSSDLPSVLQE
jgi:hypothetical protein